MMSGLSIDCVLTESCNLNCDHCFQYHNTKRLPTVASIKHVCNLLHNVFEKKILDDPNLDCFNLSIRGGEVFQDRVSSEVIKSYKDLVMELRHQFTKYTVNVEFVSNGVFNEHERVLDLLLSTNSKLSLSYDPVGRFVTEKNLKTFYRTFDFFLDHNLIEYLYITLTKDTINYYLSHPNLLKRFNNANIDFSYFILNGKSEQATDEDFYSFFKYLLDNRFYNVKYIKDMIQFSKGEINKLHGFCNCDHTVIISNGKAYNTCSVLIDNFNKADFFHDVSKVDGVIDVELLMSEGMSKRGCFSCEHFNNCEMFCWMTITNKKFTPTECPHKKIFEYIKMNKNLIDSY